VPQKTGLAKKSAISGITIQIYSKLTLSNLQLGRVIIEEIFFHSSCSSKEKLKVPFIWSTLG